MVGDSNIVSSNSAHNLGVIFDKCIKLDYHISSVCKSTYFYLRKIGSICSILSNDACAQLSYLIYTLHFFIIIIILTSPYIFHLSCTLH